MIAAPYTAPDGRPLGTRTAEGDGWALHRAWNRRKGCDSYGTAWVADGRSGFTATDSQAHAAIQRLRSGSSCAKEMRGGPCQMDAGHSGRCSTVVFGCDCCGQTRRGTPATVERDADGDVVAAVCWMCREVLTG